MWTEKSHWAKRVFLNNIIKDFRNRRRIMKFIVSITSEFGLILSLIAQTGKTTSCFALIFIPSNFVIQLALETVSPFSSTWFSKWAVWYWSRCLRQPFRSLALWLFRWPLLRWSCFVSLALASDDSLVRETFILSASFRWTCFDRGPRFMVREIPRNVERILDNVQAKFILFVGLLTTKI